MFSGCTSLTEAPALNAENLANGCYIDMFQGCTSLTEAPALKATGLKEGLKLECVAGEDRYATNAEVVKRAVEALGDAFTGTIVLTTGESFPDALCANTVAGGNGGVIVMTQPNVLSESAEAMIKSVAAAGHEVRIVVAGGADAVSDDVAEAARASAGEGCQLVRYAGDDRYGTCVAMLADPALAGRKTCIVASGAVFADALAAGSYAFASNTPILLVDETGALPAEVAEAAKGGFERAIIVGGTDAVSDDVAGQLGLGEGSVLRLGGEDRYATSKLFAVWATAASDLTAFDGNTVIQPEVVLDGNCVAFATGTGFADALSGGPLCGASRCALLLETSVSVKAIQEAVEDLNITSGKAYVLGGESALPTAL